jgi:hypothetical protein
MSNRCVGAVFERYPAGGGEMLLALALADNAHDDGTHIFPGVASMAAKSRQSVRAVQGHLRRMVEIGWLQVVRNGRGGRGRHAEYRINADWLKGAELAPFMGPQNPVDNSIKGAELGTERVQNDALKGADSRTPYITTRTVIEPNPLPPLGGAPGFAEFFAGYPRQVDQAKARREWDRLAPDEQLQGEIARAVKAWIRSPEWQRESGRFIPKPSNWLRGMRWRDVPGTAAPSPQPVAFVAPAPVLSAAQLEENGRRARAAAKHAREALGVGAMA